MKLFVLFSAVSIYILEKERVKGCNILKDFYLESLPVEALRTNLAIFKYSSIS